MFPGRRSITPWPPPNRADAAKIRKTGAAAGAAKTGKPNANKRLGIAHGRGIQQQNRRNQAAKQAKFLNEINARLAVTDGMMDRTGRR